MYINIRPLFLILVSHQMLLLHTSNWGLSMQMPSQIFHDDPACHTPCHHHVLECGFTSLSNLQCPSSEHMNSFPCRLPPSFTLFAVTSTVLGMRLYSKQNTCFSLIPRPSITANTVEGLVKLLRRMMSGRRWEAWCFR